MRSLGVRPWPLALAAAALVVGLVPGLTTQARFSDSSTAVGYSSGSGVPGNGSATDAFTSGSINSVSAPNLSQTQGTGVVAASWNPVTMSTGDGNQAVTGYELFRWDAASGGTSALVCTPTTSLSCNASRVDGTWYYELRAMVGTNWVRSSSRVSFYSKGTGTPLTDVAPTDYTGTAAGLRSLLNCPGSAPGCGTSTDPAGPPTVYYSFQANPNFTPQTYCWTGSGYVPATGACALLATTSTTSGNTTTWQIPGNEATSYPSGYPGYVRLIVSSKDFYGNITSVTFILTISG